MTVKVKSKGKAKSKTKDVKRKRKAGTGPLCPKCGERNTFVYSTNKAYPEFIRVRYYRCGDCHATFKE